MKKCMSANEILSIAKNLAKKKPIREINIREIATEANVSVGSIYRFYNSKDDLIYDIVKMIWTEIFSGYMKSTFDSFSNSLRELYKNLSEKNALYGNFLKTHALNFEMKDERAKCAMEQFKLFLEQKLLNEIKSDKRIRKDFFTSEKEEKSFVSYCLNLILFMVITDDTDIDSLIFFVEKYLGIK